MKESILIFGLFFLAISHGHGQNTPYFNQTEFGAMFGRVENQWTQDHEKRINFSMITFHGAKVSKHHAVGFSLGLDAYENLSIIPIALGWRGFWGNENGARLVAGVDIGGGATFLEKGEESEWGKSWYEGGIMASPSIGGLFPGKKGKTNLSITVAYKRQDLSYFQGSYDRGGSPRPFTNTQLPPGYNSMTETEYLFQSLVLRMGLSF